MPEYLVTIQFADGTESKESPVAEPGAIHDEARAAACREIRVRRSEGRELKVMGCLIQTKDGKFVSKYERTLGLGVSDE